MSQFDYKPEYRRNLPHIQPKGAIFFVTFRLAGSLPTAVLDRLKLEAEKQEREIAQTADPVELDRLLYAERKRQFGRYDDALDEISSGPLWLGQSNVAEIVSEALHFRDNREFELDIFCIMPNHVHAVFAPLKNDDDEWRPLQKILHSLKRYTARAANDVLKREGQFWQHESYDHIVRSQAEWERIVAYVLNNPVKAGLVAGWEDWPWTYLKE